MYFKWKKKKKKQKNKKKKKKKKKTKKKNMKERKGRKHDALIRRASAFYFRRANLAVARNFTVASIIRRQRRTARTFPR
jgi:hypothetical protein